MIRRSTQAGFTLIELMIVVTIIAVLATIAGTAYRRYMDSGRTAEAMAMLGEIRAKEEAYRAEFSVYSGWSAGSELAAASLPVVDGTTCVGGGTKEPCHKPLPTTASSYIGSWAVWLGLGLNPGRGDLQCGYVLNYGPTAPATTSSIGGTIGSGLLTTTPIGPWWYAIAICDNDGKGTGFTNATFATASNTTVVSAQNEHQ
jgi:prepilin-type N-terminal cleavage/methylation domain-containing protein